MISLRPAPPSSSLFTSHRLLPPLHHPNLLPISTKPDSSQVKMTQTIEHVVLLKVKPTTDPTKTTSMVTGLNSLASIDQVLYLSAGPIYKNRSPSSSFNFTHLLHSRYKSKQDLDAYIAHQAHLSLVKDSINPICDNVMFLDWVVDLDDPIVHPPSGAVLRVSFLKLKEGLGGNVKGEVLKVIGGGLNFSPMAKGFEIGAIKMFSGLGELEKIESNEEFAKVEDMVESAIVVDYVIG